MREMFITWLVRDKTFQILGHKQRNKGSQSYIAYGVDEELKRYYSDFNVLQLLGSVEFKESAYQAFEEIKLDEIKEAINNKPSTDEIIKKVCQYAKTSEKNVREKPPGRKGLNRIRTVAMYSCRHYGANSQKATSGSL